MGVDMHNAYARMPGGDGAHQRIGDGVISAEGEERVSALKNRSRGGGDPLNVFVASGKRDIAVVVQRAC